MEDFAKIAVVRMERAVLMKLTERAWTEMFADEPTGSPDSELMDVDFAIERLFSSFPGLLDELDSLARVGSAVHFVLGIADGMAGGINLAEIKPLKVLRERVAQGEVVWSPN